MSSSELRALKLSSIAIASTLFVEGIIGFYIGSLALISDAAHALLDAISSLIIFVAAKLSMKPPDENHTYGHGKIDALGGFVGGVFLIIISVFIGFESINRIWKGFIFQVNDWGFIAIAYTLCIDVFRVSLFRHERCSLSHSTKAGYMHAITDFASTLIAFLGLFSAKFGSANGDSLASLFLATFLGVLSVKLMYNSAMELSDAVIGVSVHRLREIIGEVEDVLEHRDLRVRKAGKMYFVEATVIVVDDMDINRAHLVAMRIEEKIRRELRNAVVTIHVEPQHREEMSSRVRRIISFFKDVKSMHDLNISTLNGKIIVSFHVELSPEISLKDAHKIIDEIEKAIKAEIPEVLNVTIHIEPSSYMKSVKLVDVEKIASKIHELVSMHSEVKGINRILAYEIKGKHVVDITCLVDEELTVEEAHEVATKLEEEIKKVLGDVKVVVHTEPFQK